MGNQVVIPSFKDWYTGPLRKKYRDLMFINPLDSGSLFLIFEGEEKKTKRKVLIKAYEYDRPLSKLPQIPVSLRMFDRLSKEKTVHGVLGYSRFFVQDNMAFLVRPMLENCLYDMIVFQQPRLEKYEKLWICFQVAQSILSLNAAGMTHGDIKPNNIFVMGNTETVLVDIAPFKPKWIDSRRPHLFYHFFASNPTAGYYMAPERMLKDHSETEDVDMEAADVFSFGCVMAFVFLDGEELFDMTKIREYWDGKFDVRKALEKIEDHEIIDWIVALVALDVNERKKAFFDVLRKFPKALQELYSTLFEHTAENLTVEGEIDRAWKLAAKVEPEASIIIFNYVVDKLLKVNTMHDYLTVVKFLRDFSKNLCDHGKATHAIPILMEFLNVNSIAVKRTTLYAMMDVIEAVTELPEAVTGLFQYSIQPRLQKLTDMSNESDETLLLAEILPYLACEVQRLAPDSLGSLCVAFGNISATVYPSVYAAFSRSMRKIAKRVDFEFFDTFFAFLLAPTNSPDDRFKTEWFKTLQEFCLNCRRDEHKLYKNKCYNAVMPVLSDMISRKTVTDAVISGIMSSYQMLLERDLLPLEASYAIIEKVTPHIRSSDVKVRYAASTLLQILTPTSKQGPLLTFLCEKVSSFPAASDELCFRRKQKIPHNELITKQEMKISPRFVSTFHNGTLPITHILKGGGGNTKFYAIENGRKVRQMSMPSRDNPLMMEYDTYSLHNNVLSCGTFEGSGAFLLGYDNGEIDIFSEIDISRKFRLFSHPEGIPTVTLVPTDSDIFVAGFTDGSAVVFDTRTSQHTTLKLGFDGLISCCKWPRDFVGFGFDGGIVSIFDMRMMLPITTGLTNVPRQICPIPCEYSSIAIATSDGTRLDFLEKMPSELSFRNIMAIKVPPMRILPLHEGVLMIDQMSASYITATSGSKLYDGLLVESPLPTTSLSIPFSACGAGQGCSSVHGHTCQILTAEICNSMVISGDDCGFISAWQVSKTGLL